MKTFYHVTLQENYNSIMEQGLLPKIGEMSSACEEVIPRIYLFPTLEDMENALMNWMGMWYEDNYGEDVELCSLKITLPDNFPIFFDVDVPYECYSYETINSENIVYFREE